MYFVAHLRMLENSAKINTIIDHQNYDVITIPLTCPPPEQLTPIKDIEDMTFLVNYFQQHITHKISVLPVYKIPLLALHYIIYFLYCRGHILGPRELLA